jgi:MFS family permease
MQLPITSALLYEYSPPDRGGESIGLRVMLVNVNATILPLAAGTISDLIGVIPVFLLAALILLGIALQNRHMWRHHKAASASP